MKSGHTLDAAQTFEIAAERPMSQTKTTAIYLAGQAWFNLEEYERAKRWFNLLIENYPKSTYVEDASYHKAWILMSTDDNTFRELGLDLMFEIASRTTDNRMKKDAEAAIKYHLFNVYDGRFAEIYYQYVREEHKLIVLEAICHHLAAADDSEMINVRIDDYIADGGKPSRYLIALKRRNSQGGGNNISLTEELRIAVILPMHLEYMDTATVVPSKCRRAMEMYEGMKMAIDSGMQDYSRTVIVKAFDSKRDTGVVSGILEKLDAYMPDVIIGDISTRTAKKISHWAEENHVLHFVPLNPDPSITKEKENIFLTHPSIETHGRAMADYIVTGLRKKKIVAFVDGSKIARQQFDAFKAQMDSLGGKVIRKMVPNYVDKDNAPAIISIVRSLYGNSFDGVYIPISSEEVAGLIISRLNDKYKPIETQVFGSPDWEYFDAIDGELKSEYGLVFSTPYYDQSDSLAMDEFRDTYIYEYGTFPTQFVVQGYDIMNYILATFENSNDVLAPNEMIRSAPNYYGIHQTINYKGKQDNQVVTLVRYVDGKLKKVWPREEE